MDWSIVRDDEPVCLLGCIRLASDGWSELREGDKPRVEMFSSWDPHPPRGDEAVDDFRWVR